MSLTNCGAVWAVWMRAVADYLASLYLVLGEAVEVVMEELVADSSAVEVVVVVHSRAVQVLETA